MSSLSPLDLKNPETFGEDLPFNLEKVSTLAKAYCRGCEDYHVLFTARRVSAQDIEPDRATIADLVSQFAAERAHALETMRIIVAGAADTGVLATVVHGVARSGDAVLRKTSFTVVDRCETPLALCRIFGDRHHLDVATRDADICADDIPFEADLIVVHSLFRHLPTDVHPTTLRKLSGWLSTDGRLIFSHRIAGGGDTENRRTERGLTATRIRRGIESGQLVLGESLESFEARFARRAAAPAVHVSEYASTDELLALFAAAHLKVHSIQSLTGPGASTRQRVIAVLGKN